MIRLLTRTDVHLSDRNPSSRTDDWAETVLDKLAQTYKIAEHVKCSAILDNGDFFHIKSPTRTSHDLVRRVAEQHYRYNMPVYGNVGNHDCVYGDLLYLPQQPLGVLFASSVFNRCYDEHEALFEDEDGLKVRVVGIPFHGDRYDMDRFTRIKKGDEDYLLVMAHVLASEKGGQMFEGEDIIKYGDLVGLDPDLWLFGHWHKDQGITEIGGKTFINVGSLTRGALHLDDLDRAPKCSLIEFTKDGIKVRVVPLRVKPAAEVFDLNAKTRSEARSMTMESFVDTLRKTLLDRKDISLEESVQKMDLPTKVKERALLLLERAV